MSNSDIQNKNILLLVSGSVAAFKSIALASALIKKGFSVRVALSDHALRFVGPASFEGITGEKTYVSSFEEGSMMAHIDLERWADLILFYPASAESLSALASGSGSNLPSVLFLAHEFKKPFLVAPAMNQAMWKHPALKRNLDLIQSYGVTILSPGSGTLACGETGEGRLMEPEEALSRVMELLDIAQIKKESGKPRVLITAGGTSEPIDEVRHLRNMSTGRTGHGLALTLQKAGFQVTLFQSETSFARSGIETIKLYSTTQDFASKMKRELEDSSYDFVIHSAAVADYHVAAVTDPDGKPVNTSGKIQTDLPLFLKLVPNPKVIRELRTWSRNKNLKIISFKLTSGLSDDLKLDTYDSEWIIHNHLRDVGDLSHLGTVYQRMPDHSYSPIDTFKTKSELQGKILKLLDSTPLEVKNDSSS